MKTISIFILALSLLLGIVAVIFYRHARYSPVFDKNYRADANPAYIVKRARLITGNEQEFMGRITAAVGDKYHIWPQVCMGALIETTISESHPDYWVVRAGHAAKIVDYVLCDKKSTKPLLIIELDDITHDANADELRDKITRAAGLQTLRYHSRTKPSIAELRQDIAHMLSSPTITQIKPKVAMAPQVNGTLF